MTTMPALNLDKLRHVVQKFGSHSFTTAQLVRDYHHGQAVFEEHYRTLEDALQQHATLLGICAQPSATPHSSASGSTRWAAV